MNTIYSLFFMIKTARPLQAVDIQSTWKQTCKMEEY